MAIKVLAGDIGAANYYTFASSADGFYMLLPKTRWFSGKNINLSFARDFLTVEQQDEESVRKLSGMAGWALVGAAVAGPIGAIIGGIFGGRRKEILFAAELRDGRKFLAVTDGKTWQKIQAARFGAA